MTGQIDCSTDGQHPATRWAGYHPPGMYANQSVLEVLALAPEFGANTTITGTYTGRTMPGATIRVDQDGASSSW